MHYAKMDEFALNLVKRYVSGEVDTEPSVSNFLNADNYSNINAYVVHKSMVLDKVSYIIKTDFDSDRYYHVTHDLKTSEWYMDVYQNFDSVFLNRSGKLAHYQAIFACNGDSCPIE